MFKKQYKIIHSSSSGKLEQEVYLEMNSEGWVPLGGAFYTDGGEAAVRGWWQTMWLPEDPHTTGLVPGLSKGEEILTEVQSSIEFAGKPPRGKYDKADEGF
jgi:hypothetical protein